jgi:Skp family chaperone for outer membrane proteins
MKKMILILCVLCSTHMFGQQIGYVYSDSVLQSIPEYGRNVSKLDSLKKTYNKELEQNRTSLQKRYEALVKGYKPSEKESLPSLKARMSQADTISLGLLLEEDKMIQKKAWSYESMTKLVYARDIQSVLDLVKKTISEYAIKNKLTAVYVMEQIRPTLVYIDSKQDITQAIIEKLKRKQ